MDMPISAPTLQLLEWLAERQRTREETLEAWQTNCPRLSIWEDACIEGLVEASSEGPWIAVSVKGKQLLSSTSAGR
jgi:hypothetical protein